MSHTAVATVTVTVSMVLHGEIGMSETRELVGPEDCQVFQTNSRDTFLLTLPASIGPIWKVQLWHDNKGVARDGT
ncbi:PKD1L1 [Bugula neritina]|uniref:PKD1L1 n=1 Tax=Bugula neritina TaxID=10212 RepID=A0A7J7KBK3_BUGNE|nr:PKD1L1 [Bugula neritina]